MLGIVHGPIHLEERDHHTRQGTDTWTSVVHNDYGSGAGYALGAPTVTTTSDSKNGSYQYGTTTTNAFAWWDGAVQSSVTFAKTSQPTYTTTYSYGGSGQLASIYVADGRPRTITFTTDMLGQVVRRDEADNVTSGTALPASGAASFMRVQRKPARPQPLIRQERDFALVRLSGDDFSYRAGDKTVNAGAVQRAGPTWWQDGKTLPSSR